MATRKRIIIGLGVIVAYLAFMGCDDGLDFNNKDCVKGEGQIVTKSLSLDSFTAIDNQGTSDITITQGPEQKVVAIGHANIVDKISTEVHDGSWNVHVDMKCYTDIDLRYEVQVPELKSLIISGTGNIRVGDFNAQEELALEISGTGNIELQKYEGCQKIDARISGTGNINFLENWEGLENEDVVISGTGNFRSFPLQTKKCNVTLSATGTCQVNVEDELDVRLTGSGAVQYMGNPSVNANITGVGVVQQVN